MTAAANTKACIQQFIGRKVIGVLFDALPVNHADLSKGTKTLVFDDGRGLTFSSKGSFWSDSPDDVRRAVRQVRDRLSATQHDLAGVLRLAGEVGPPNQEDE